LCCVMLCCVVFLLRSIRKLCHQTRRSYKNATQTNYCCRPLKNENATIQKHSHTHAHGTYLFRSVFEKHDADRQYLTETIQNTRTRPSVRFGLLCFVALRCLHSFLLLLRVLSCLVLSCLASLRCRGKDNGRTPTKNPDPTRKTRWRVFLW